MSVKNTLTAAQVYDIMTRLGLRAPDTRRVDRAVALVDADYIRTDFGRVFRSNLWSLGLGTYQPECWDCDDYALAAKHQANVEHARTEPGAGVGIAFGIYHYTVEADAQGRQQGHAINFYLSMEAGEIKLHFWEPQTQQEVFLTQSERTGGWYYL